MFHIKEEFECDQKNVQTFASCTIEKCNSQDTNYDVKVEKDSFEGDNAFVRKTNLERDSFLEEELCDNKLLLAVPINSSSEEIEIKEEIIEPKDYEMAGKEDMLVPTVSPKPEPIFRADEEESSEKSLFESKLSSNGKPNINIEGVRYSSKRISRKASISARLKIRKVSKNVLLSDTELDEHGPCEEKDVKLVEKKPIKLQKFHEDIVSNKHGKKIRPETGKKTENITKTSKIAEQISVSQNIENETIPGKKHKCNICNKAFRAVSVLRRHTSVHTGERPVKCPVWKDCPKRFNSKWHALVHAEKHHPNSKPFHFEDASEKKRGEKKKLVCDICGLEISCLSWYNIHKRSHTGERPFECSVCSRFFISNAAMLDHKKSHPGFKQLVCEICGKQFPRKSKLKRHLDTHSGIKPFPCGLCDMTFSRKDSLQNHLLKIHSIGEAEITPGVSSSSLYKCEDCGKCFSSRYELRSHRVVHAEEKPFECSVCKKNFKTKLDLESHVQIHKTERKNICELCGRGFTARGDLVKHMKIHSEEKPHSCPICQKAFRSYSNMKIHTEIHSTGDSREKPFSCDQCGKSFFANSSLRRHSVIHLDLGKDKPFSCSVCHRLFPKEEQMVKHQQTHEGTFQCSVCLKGFSKQSTFEQHKLTHLNQNLTNNHTDSGEKPKILFSCRICEKGFQKKPTLTRHLRIHSRETPFECPVCCKVFSRKDLGLTHCKVMHKMVPPK